MRQRTLKYRQEDELFAATGVTSAIFTKTVSALKLSEDKEFERISQENMKKTAMGVQKFKEIMMNQMQKEQ